MLIFILGLAAVLAFFIFLIIFALSDKEVRQSIKQYLSYKKGFKSLKDSVVVGAKVSNYHECPFKIEHKYNITRVLGNWIEMYSVKKKTHSNEHEIIYCDLEEFSKYYVIIKEEENASDK